MTIRRIVGLADEALTRSIIAAFYDVYNCLGFGFLESVYAGALARELRARGHKVEREVLVKVWFKGQLIARQRVDMLVDDRPNVRKEHGSAESDVPVLIRDSLTDVGPGTRPVDDASKL